MGTLRNSDRIYTPLPLYHTAGGIMAVGLTLVHGHTTVIKKKFSASAYFADCIKYKCTVSIIFLFVIDCLILGVIIIYNTFNLFRTTHVHKISISHFPVFISWNFMDCIFLRFLFINETLR